MTYSALSPAGNGIQSVTVGGGGGQRCKWGTPDHLGLNTRAVRRLRAQSDLKRLLTHIRCHGWHFGTLHLSAVRLKSPVCECVFDLYVLCMYSALPSSICP